MLFEQVFASRPGIEPEEIVRRGAPPGYGEWLSAQVAAGFDRTTSARFMEAADIARAEAGAGESDAAWMLRRAAAGMGDEMGEALTDALDFSGAKDAGAPHTHALTERDWKASPWYRKEIPYRPDMTPTRARIMAENFDERRRRDRLIAAGSERYDGLGNMALGFGASLLGSLPDPVNFIPFGGGLKAARTAGSLGKAVLAGARAGAVEGAVSTALADAVVLPDLASRGEDVGFADLALDVLAGGVLGSVFGAGGGALARRSAARNAPESAASVMPDPADILELALEDRGSGLMREHARNMARARVAAGADPDSAAEESHAAAALFDARARRWAVDFHASPEDYYRERLPKYRTATGAEAGSGAALFHGQTVKSAAEKLAEEAEAWAGLVDGLKAKPEKAQRMLSQTPLVFHLLGAKFREVYAAPHVFDGMFPGKAKKGHHAHTNIDASILKQIPSALADPIAVFRSNSVAGRLVFMVDVTDANGANVVLPVHLDAQHDFASIHILTSAYSKEKNGVPNNKWFETQAGNLLYVNRKKEERWNTSSGSNSLWVLSNALDAQSVLTEADLVKLKKTFPDMYQSADRPRARLLFDAREDGRAVIEFFRAADASSAPHELYHIFRREMAESAVRPDAPRYLVDDWKRIEAFVGVEPGKPWTRDMEEKFARAGERFLLEGIAPTAELRGVFERLRQWFLNIYRQMDDAGLHISPAMREVFSRMFAAPARNADNDALRGTLTAGDRRALAAATDAALDDIAAARPVDVGDALREAGVLERTERGMSNPVVVRSEDLGVPEGAGLPEYIAAAKACHDALKLESESGKPVIQPQLEKPVRFSRKGWRKNQSTGADADKWKLFPKPREIIETSTLKSTEAVNKPRKDGFVRFHWVENVVELDGSPRLVGVMLAEDAKGNLFYNINADVEGWRAKKGDPSKLPAQSMTGESGSPIQAEAAAPPVTSRLAEEGAGVNLHVEDMDGLSPDFSTAAEPPAPPRMTPDEARRAESQALANQDEALRQGLDELEARGAADAEELAGARTDAESTEALGREALNCAWTVEE